MAALEDNTIKALLVHRPERAELIGRVAAIRQDFRLPPTRRRDPRLLGHWLLLSLPCRGSVPC